MIKTAFLAALLCLARAYPQREEELYSDSYEIDKTQNYPDYQTHPKYTFKYGVSDGDSGDVKRAEETRDGDVVRGEYSFLQPDGTIRRVQYTADNNSGFKAVVRTERPPKNNNYYQDY